MYVITFDKILIFGLHCDFDNLPFLDTPCASVITKLLKM